jgi:hypothetical protein
MWLDWQRNNEKLIYQLRSLLFGVFFNRLILILESEPNLSSYSWLVHITCNIKLSIDVLWHSLDLYEVLSLLFFIFLVVSFWQLTERQMTPTFTANIFNRGKHKYLLYKIFLKYHLIVWTSHCFLIKWLMCRRLYWKSILLNCSCNLWPKFNYNKLI